MKTIRFLGHGKVSIEDVPAPARDEGSVLVQVKASAICGSELHALLGPPRDRPGRYNDGHEVAGVVVEAPPGCACPPGTRVGACIVQGCGACDACRIGRDTACRHKRYFGWNGHSEYYVLGLRGAKPIPDGVDWPAAAILTGDGLGVPTRCARRLGDTRGRRIVVLGLGPIGLSCVLVQHFRGARVLAADLSDYRVRMALDLGAERAVNVQAEDLKQAVLDWTAGAGADVVILCVAKDEAVRSAIGLLRHQGVFCLLAELAGADFVLNDALIRKEVTMMGSWYYAQEDWPKMLALHEAKLPYRRLVTHTFPPERAQEAYDTFTSGQSGKVVLTW
jgi:threonine dehydrogenase-like Zn-dependent dehydrogenase